MHTSASGALHPLGDHPSAVPEPETAEDALMSLMMALGRKLRQRQPGDAVDFATFPILKCLAHQGPTRLSVLAQTLGLDASTVSRHARQLEDRGLIERSEDPDDGRASRVSLSAHGSESLAKGFAVRRQLVSAALEDWSGQDRETLRVLLHRVVADLSDLPSSPSTSSTSTSSTSSTQETSA